MNIRSSLDRGTCVTIWLKPDPKTTTRSLVSGVLLTSTMLTRSFFQLQRILQ